MTRELVAVTSRSFSRSKSLRQCLQARYAQVRFNDEGLKLKDESLVRFLSGAKRAIIGLETIDEDLLDQLPDLQVICKMGTGTDKVNLDAIKKRNIIFSHTPGVNKRSVSELVFGLIFMLLRRLPVVQTLVKQGCWEQPTGQLLSTKTVGVIGYGAIGQDLVALLCAFGCNCLIFDVQYHDVLIPQVLQVDLDTLLAQADIISLHIPLLSENYHFFDENKLFKMKKGAILINTARGGLVDEIALHKALVSGQLFAAAMDVFEYEPEVPKNLLKLNNFIATSHIGGSTEEAIEAMGRLAIYQLEKIE